jgi:hypothetical protein
MMDQIRYPYIVKRHHACVHQNIPIIFVREPGVRYDNGKFIVGYPEEPFGDDGKLTNHCRQFLIELQMRDKLFPLIVFGKNDSAFIDMKNYNPGIQDFHGTLFIRTTGFYRKKEWSFPDNHVSDGRKAALMVKRTPCGSYLLFFRYGDNGEEQWIAEGNLSDVADTAGKILSRTVVAEESGPLYRLENGNLTADGCPVLKIFGTESGTRWFVTLAENLRDVSDQGPGPDENGEEGVTQYFGVIREGDKETWDFWMDEDIDPLLRSGEAREYRADELGFLDLATIDSAYFE